MKNTLAIIFLLVANITLLVHSAIPHHNHEGDLCFISTSCENECDSHDHNEHHQHQKHEHHGEHGNMECELDTKVIIPSNINPKQEVIILDLDLNPLVNFNIISKIPEFSQPKHILKDFKTHIPLKLSLYHIYINNSTGLRAPPTFV